MYPPIKILFAVDFSERARALAPAVRELAKLCDAEVNVLHTVELGPHHPYENEASQAREKLDALISEDLKGCNIVVHITPGDPASKIVEIARSGGADLIMMPTRGRGLFHIPVIGSVTARVLHDAPCPVWTDAQRRDVAAYPQHGIRTVVCAVDLGSRSSVVLGLAARVAEFWEASLRLVHVMEFSPKADWTQERRAQMTPVVEGQLKQLAEEAGGRPIIEALDGSPIEEVLAAAERCHADLIVVGRTLVLEDEVHEGATSYGIVAGSHCPVLSV